jgi:tRNA modification GTPase
MADSIFAQATPPGRSGVAVIRISGPEAVAAAARLGADGLEARRASVRRLHDPNDGRLIDTALALRFDAPASFTGEDVVELQVHGSLAVCRGLCGALGRLPGLRAAEPGEFTRRALTNGKLDLAQVEGLGDLLMAETAAQARQALELAEGRLSAIAAGWRRDLVRALALLDASIDFADEELPEVVGEVRTLLAGVATQMEAQVAGAAAHERVREGFEVVLVGAPNVGKSTLLNALAGREAAITSDAPGTTRDAVEVRMDLGGLLVTFVDVAGLREATDVVEVIGVERARKRAGRADMRLFLVEGVEADGLGVDQEAGDLIVRAKADLRAEAAAPAVSGLTGEGVAELLSRVAEELAARAAGAGTVGHERHRVAVERALVAVREATARANPGGEAELAAADVRAALGALDRLVGKVDVNAVLDVIFHSFCIGK